MDYYLLVPSYVNRLLAVMKTIKSGKSFLNVGCGKGGFNYALRNKFDHLEGIDINAFDIEVANKLYSSPTCRYRVMDAGALRYKDRSVDTVLCCEVLEHIPNKDTVVAECKRVLRKGGQFLVLVPTKEFPFVYDPINWILQRFGLHLNIGAYSFGHDKLPSQSEIVELLEKKGFEIVTTSYISHQLVCLMEAYHVGLWQRILKENAKNNGQMIHKSVLSYDYAQPRAWMLAKLVVWLDNLFFGWSKRGMGIIINARSK